jgi:hypothetical protein
MTTTANTGKGERFYSGARTCSQAKLANGLFTYGYWVDGS